MISDFLFVIVFLTIILKLRFYYLKKQRFYYKNLRSFIYRCFNKFNLTKYLFKRYICMGDD